MMHCIAAELKQTMQQTGLTMDWDHFMNISSNILCPLYIICKCLFFPAGLTTLEKEKEASPLG